MDCETQIRLVFHRYTSIIWRFIYLVEDSFVPCAPHQPRPEHVTLWLRCSAWHAESLLWLRTGDREVFVQEVITRRCRQSLQTRHLQYEEAMEPGTRAVDALTKDETSGGVITGECDMENKPKPWTRCSH